MIRPLEIQAAMRERFGLVPLTSVQRRGLSKKEAKRERKRDKRRRRAERATGHVIREWLVFDGRLTEAQAVGFALLGVSVWAFFLRMFLAEVARWTFRRLILQRERDAGAK